MDELEEDYSLVTITVYSPEYGTIESEQFLQSDANIYDLQTVLRATDRSLIIPTKNTKGEMVITILNNEALYGAIIEIHKQQVSCVSESETKNLPKENGTG